MELKDISLYFSNIKDDINLLYNEKDKEKEMRDLRIRSLAWRAFGSLCLTVSVVTTLSVIVNPPLATLDVISCLFCLALSHDYIQLGLNKRELIPILEDFIPDIKDVEVWPQTVTHFCEDANDLEDTWIMGPTFNFLKKMSPKTQ